MNFRRTKNRHPFFTLCLFFLLAFSLAGFSQNEPVTGRVIHAGSQSPVPFVLIRFNNGNQGIIGDAGGFFTVPGNIRSVKFNSPGFKSLTVALPDHGPKNLTVSLQPENGSSRTDPNSAGAFAARQVMTSVLIHSEKNNHANLESYQYVSDNRFLLSTDPVSGEQQEGRKKISILELEKMQQRFKADHMLSVETISRKKFLQPKHENEEIISTREAGLSKEVFKMLSAQMQNISVYDEHISLLDRDYPSPAGKSALKYYHFVLEDTLLTDSQDTTFLIRYYPSREHKFDGLKGALQVSSNGYAVRNFTAEPASVDKKPVYAFIWHHFDRLENGQWFPSGMNAAVNFKMVTALPLESRKNISKPVDLSVTALSQTKLSERQANILIDPKSFPKYGVTLSPGRKDSLYGFRVFNTIPLTTSDSLTNHYLDSLERKARLTQKVKLIHSLSLGKIPIGVISINYTYLFGYNINEGYKVGLGIESNRKLSNYFATGLYFTYGTRDGQFRHGEWLRIYPTGYPDFKIELGHKDVKKEYGVEELLTEDDLTEPEYYRSLLVNNMYYTNNYYGSVEIRPIQVLNLKFFTDYAYNSRNSYGNFSDMEWDPFRLTRAGLEIRYSPGISFLNDREELIKSTPPKSDFYLTVVQGLKLLESAYQFTKIDSKAKFNIRLSALGNTSVMVRGGIIFNEAPITEWFHGYGSYPASFTLLAHYAFATMRLNEFSADRYANLHIRHNFGSGFLPSFFIFRPELSLAQNIGFGTLRQSYRDLSGTRDFGKGFYESGIELNKIININFIGLGLGAYYRYGPYRLEGTMENFAYKFTLLFKF